MQEAGYSSDVSEYDLRFTAGLRYRHTGCHHVLRPGNWTFRQPAWQEAAADGRLWSSTDPRPSVHPDPQRRKPNRHPTARRRCECNLWCCLDPRGGGQNSCHGPLQFRPRQSSNSSRARCSSQHDVGREADSALHLPNLFPVSGSDRRTRVCVAVDGDSRDSYERETKPGNNTSSPLNPQEISA